MSDTKFSLAHRLLHWAIAFSLLFMLLTIFLRLGWMNKHNMADIISDKLQDIDVKIDEEQAITIAKGVRSPMWAWHVYIGYVLVGLYILRMAFFITKGASFKQNLLKGVLKEKVQAWSYVLFYVLLGSALISGLIIEFGSEKYKHTTEEYHELSLYWLVLFIVVHFIGLYIPEIKNRKGIVNKMITGKD